MLENQIQNMNKFEQFSTNINLEERMNIKKNLFELETKILECSNILVVISIRLHFSSNTAINSASIRFFDHLLSIAWNNHISTIIQFYRKFEGIRMQTYRTSSMKVLGPRKSISKRS